MHEDVLDTFYDLRMAQIYNSYTGANITHRDWAEIGYAEEAAILAAFQIWSIFD